MLTKVTKIIGLGVVLMAVMAGTLLLINTPALAQPQPPATDQPSIAAAPAAGHSPTHFYLCAKSSTLTTTVTMPDGVSIPIWGFAPVDGGGLCNGNPAQLPGPVLRVNVSDVVIVTLQNALPVTTSILFPGQTGGVTTSGGSPGLFTAEAPPCAGSCAVLVDYGVVTYTFTANAAGTYLYETGTDPQIQVPMGLYGALIVDPVPATIPPQAYSSSSTAYDVEEILVLSEIDPELNDDVSGTNLTPTVFDLLNYRPTYWLLNGRAFGPGNANPDVLDPDAPGTSQPYSSAISAAAGQEVLVRYINAGGTHHTMSLLGLHQRIIAKDADANPGLGQPLDVVAETIASGQTTDAIIGSVPAGSYPLYNRQLHLTNGGPGAGHFFPGGGMMTFITVP